jgi:hypothetical protein
VLYCVHFGNAALACVLRDTWGGGVCVLRWFCLRDVWARAGPMLDQGPLKLSASFLPSSCHFSFLSLLSVFSFFICWHKSS